MTKSQKYDIPMGNIYPHLHINVQKADSALLATVAYIKNCSVYGNNCSVRNQLKQLPILAVSSSLCTCSLLTTVTSQVQK